MIEYALAALGAILAAWWLRQKPEGEKPALNEGSIGPNEIHG